VSTGVHQWLKSLRFCFAADKCTGAQGPACVEKTKTQAEARALNLLAASSLPPSRRSGAMVRRESGWLDPSARSADITIYTV
jgi:hypothetical protein